MRVIYSFPIIFILIGLWGCQTSQQAPPENFKTLKIYHTNDIHAHLSPDGEGRGGLAYVSSVLKLVRNQDKDALILDAGDFYKKGSLPSQNSNDEVTAELIQKMPYYDARAVGNNELKVGVTKFLGWAKSKETAPLLSANFVDKNKKLVFPPYIILNKMGLRIGIIGLTPKFALEASAQADPKTDPNAPYELEDPNGAVLPFLALLRPQVDVLIVLAHNNYNDNLALAKAHPEIDLVVSGHSHVLTGDQKKLNENMVVEAGQFGQQIGVLNLVYDANLKKVTSLESTFWKVGHNLQLPDPNVADAIQKAYEKWAPDARTRLGEAASTLSVVDLSNPVEGTLDDWVSDRICAKVQCDVALLNTEMLRENVHKGVIVKDDVFLAAPYDDQFAVVSISSEKLKKMLTENVKKKFNKTTLFPFNFSGMSAVLNLTNQHFNGVTFNIASTKENLTVVVPYYMTTHCQEFFAPEYCPFADVKKDIAVRPFLESEVVKAGVIHPPPANRVVVQQQGVPSEIKSDGIDIAPDSDGP